MERSPACGRNTSDAQRQEVRRLLRELQEGQEDLRQLAEEKVLLARSACDLVDARLFALPSTERLHAYMRWRALQDCREPSIHRRHLVYLFRGTTLSRLHPLRRVRLHRLHAWIVRSSTPTKASVTAAPN